MFKVRGSVNLEDLKNRVTMFKRQSAMARLASRMVFKVSEYFHKGAPSRHKWANKLGADPTGVLEFTPDEGRATSKTGATIQTEAVEPCTATISVEGIMGIGRAFHDLDIRPKNASALTVPIDKASYAKTVADLKGEGWNIFRKGRLLVGNKGSSSGVGIPLFVLCGHVHIPQDKELFPSSSHLYGWAIDEASKDILAANYVV